MLEYDERAAFANGLVVVSAGDGKAMVVRVTGTGGEGERSHWRGAVLWIGQQDRASAFIAGYISATR